VTLLRKLTQLDAAERRLLAEAAFVVPTVRLALTLLPFRIVHRGIAAATRRSHRRSASSASQTPERIARMIAAVAARVPRASCLTQALAATLLLARDGHAATLRVGVAKNEDGSLRAHAWLESGGQTLLGGPDSGAFVHLPPLAFSRR
jgi:hypothetical protein